MQELTLLHTKLDTLLKKYAALQAENKALQETVRQQRDTLQQLTGKVTELETNIATEQTANVLTTKGETANMRKQLNTLIGDIDKLLASLND